MSIKESKVLTSGLLGLIDELKKQKLEGKEQLKTKYKELKLNEAKLKKQQGELRQPKFLEFSEGEKTNLTEVKTFVKNLKDLHKVVNANVLTDKKLLDWYFKTIGLQVEPITTDRFIEKSKSTYNAAWLAREIIQNFVDHNPHFPGTLDGVEIKTIDIGNGKKRFEITGDWPFKDTTGLTTPHSEKPEGTNTAGGNGIGMKQAALRLFRDFGVSRFSVFGEGWEVNYKLAEANKINNKIASYGPHRLKHDWLLGDIKKSSNKGKCTYIIETGNKEVINAFSSMRDLGVSKDNSYLKDPDFQNEHGAIKILKCDRFDLFNNKKIETGRLFINGQVMNYKSKGETAEDYWRGPELLSIRLNNLDYEMSIDRPPVTSYKLSDYLEPLLNSMKVEEKIDLLKKLEFLWSDFSPRGASFGSDKYAYWVLIESIISNLYWSNDYSKDDFNKYFEEGKYLYQSSKVSPNEEASLKAKGFKICPEFFKDIGMPSVISVLPKEAAATKEKPDLSSYDKKRRAEEEGIELATSELKAYSREELFELIKYKLGDQIVDIKADDSNPSKFDIYLKSKIDNKLLYHALPKPKTAEQRTLHFVRSLILNGLSNDIFADAYTVSNEYLVNYHASYDSVIEDHSLTAKNVDINKQHDGLKISLSLNSKEDIEAFKGAFFGEGNFAEEVKRSIQKRKEIRKIKTNTELPAEELERLGDIKENIPGIEKIIGELDSLIPNPKTSKRDKVDSPFEQYAKWKQSGDFYGQGGKREYLGGNSLLDILTKYNQADIPVVETSQNATKEEKEVARLNHRLKAIVNKTCAWGDEVDDFELILQPSKKQVQQLNMLRKYVELTTGVEIPNDLFVYRGSGSKGINIGKRAIGLHEELLNASFGEALRTMVHEVAHNEYMNHGNGFRHMVESLFTKIQDVTNDIIEKVEIGQKLNSEEKAIVNTRALWNMELAQKKETIAIKSNTKSSRWLKHKSSLGEGDSPNASYSKLFKQSDKGVTVSS